MIYTAKKVIHKILINGSTTKDIWSKAEVAELKNYFGNYPNPFPEVKVKIAYDDEALYLLFEVHDQYVKAVHTGYQADVWKDSCVEFFFTPGENRRFGYFNLEINCSGHALFQFWENGVVTEISKKDFGRIEIYHTLPKIIVEEIVSPLTWFVEYRLPVEILKKYTRVTKPEPGKKWRINLYKCADETSHPHWLMWAKIDNDKPNFHLPEYFGELNFE